MIAAAAAVVVVVVMEVAVVQLAARAKLGRRATSLMHLTFRPKLPRHELGQQLRQRQIIMITSTAEPAADVR